MNFASKKMANHGRQKSAHEESEMLWKSWYQVLPTQPRKLYIKYPETERINHLNQIFRIHMETRFLQVTCLENKLIHFTPLPKEMDRMVQLYQPNCRGTVNQ